MGAASNLNYLDGLDLFDTYAVTVKNIDAFLGLHKPKELLNHNWPDEPGRDYDVSQPRIPDIKEITLKCAFICSLEEYKTKSEAFMNAICAPGYRQWTVVFQNTTYSVLYNGSSDPQYLGGKANANKVILEFNLALIVQPVLMPGNNYEIIVDLNGEQYNTYPAGTQYINVETLGGGEAPTVSINNITVEDNIIVVDATAPAGYTLQYSLSNTKIITPRFYNYQTSNRFENLVNDTYKVRVRLLEATNIYATSGDVIVDYTAPAPAESVSIENVTTDRNTIFILAKKANTTREIEYSFDNGATWQAGSSKTVANGTYGPFQARLVGTSVVATWDGTLVINYAPPATAFNTILLPDEYSGPVSFYGEAGAQFHFNNPIASEPPFPASMTLYVDGNPVGRVDFPVGALGKPCAISFNGFTYLVAGGFQDSGRVDVN